MMMTMEDPFFRKTNTRPGFRSPKVVSIPISFVGSSEKKKTRSDDAAAAAAGRIQKVFRGFLVRKSVRKIVAIKRQVEEIERKVMERETVEMVRRDGKERLRINEMLMALLLRLDSVRGVDSGVRDCRKVVIRKAIALQEKLDAIAEEDQSEAKLLLMTMMIEEAIDQIRSEDQEGAMEAPVESSTDEITEKENLDSETEMKLGEEDSAEAEITMTAAAAAAEEEEEDEKEMEERSRAMMERMLKDNEKLMGLMSQLCERNAMQTQMISSLSQRVENLEKAFICDKLKRKKKKMNAAEKQEECTPDARKCGRKL
ncbi:hypothetical protein Syun_020205 [Stephania yunnanensis]|uniref:BAG domain-containing protein n=1 Tax=Stephania yunnanensis TaxID=152371 RepID=A0AAP0NNN9_9MAGN